MLIRTTCTGSVSLGTSRSHQFESFLNFLPRPSGDWGSLPLEGGIEAAYKRQLDALETPEEREKLMAELLDKFEDVRSPLKTAHKFGIEEIIDPRDTRPMACEVGFLSLSIHDGVIDYGNPAVGGPRI